MLPIQSIAARYQVILRDTTGKKVAMFDSFELEYGKVLNDVDYHVLTLDGKDSRCELFDLDYLIDVQRSVPGCGLDWYTDYGGFHRDPTYSFQNRKYVYQSKGVGLNDLLMRTRIAYKGGTIRAEKNAPADTVMKEYVEENCGVSATVANGRESEGTLPGFTVEASAGTGVVWGGSKEFENLLDILKLLGMYTDMDFAVIANDNTSTGVPGFLFKTYNNHMGKDRTTVGLNNTTGLNAAGNVPVIFAVENGNVQSLSYIVSHIPEINVAIVLGKGDKSTRAVIAIVNNLAIAKSPWNRCETVVNANNQDFQYQLIAAGLEALVNGQAKEQFGFEPLQQPNALYGKDYNLGDMVTARVKGNLIVKHKRIMAVRINVTAGRETINIDFADVL